MEEEGTGVESLEGGGWRAKGKKKKEHCIEKYKTNVTDTLLVKLIPLYVQIKELIKCNFRDQKIYCESY